MGPMYDPRGDRVDASDAARAAAAVPAAGPLPSDPLVQVTRGLAGLVARYHRATLEGADRLPPGGALLVGNHGLYGFETFAFFYLLHAATGRFPVGLTDRLLFGHGPLRTLLARVGGILGTPDNARELLAARHLVVCYPGGSREVFKRPDAHYRLRWERALGFARVAICAGVPVCPFAGLGVDDSYVNLGPLPVLERVLGRYAAPVAVGLGPFPWPARFRFVLGEPLAPPADERDAPTFKRDVQAAVERLLGSGAS